VTGLDWTDHNENPLTKQLNNYTSVVMKMTGIKIAALNSQQSKELAGMFHLLGDPTRLKIVLAFANCEIPVNVIAEAAGVSLPLTSHHLRLLRTSGLVRAVRKGRQVFYSLADAHVGHMLKDMTEHILECGGTKVRETEA